MIIQCYAIRTAVGLALSSLLLVCAPRVGWAATGLCESIFKPTTWVFDQQQKLNLVRSSVLIDGRVVYYEHLRAKPGKKTLVVFSGLFVPMSDFAAFQVEFARQAKGEGLLLLAYSTQIESMIWSALRYEKQPNFSDVSLVGFSREATAALRAENISAPIAVMGFSYGTAPAVQFAEFHRRRVSDLIMVAPLIVPGDHSLSIHSGKDMYEAFARMNPIFGSSILDSMRSTAARKTAESIVDNYLTTQKLPVPVTREMVVDGLVAQIRAAEAFDLRNENSARWPRTSFLMGELEQPYRLSLQQALFEKISNASQVRGEGELVKDGKHTLAASNAQVTVEFVLRVMRGQPQPIPKK